MPDWSYQTLFRPLLFTLPSRISRYFTLNAMGRISRIPGGSFIIRTLGHMESSPLLERKLGSLALQTPLGLSGSVDPDGTAHRALAQFGFGFIEWGPVTASPIMADAPIDNDASSETIHYPDYFENIGAAAIAERIKRCKHRLPQLARIAPMPDASPELALQQLGDMMRLLEEAGAAGFYVDIASAACRPWEEVLEINAGLPALVAGAQHPSPPWYLYIPLDMPEERLVQLLKPIDPASQRLLWQGAVVGEASPTKHSVLLKHPPASGANSNAQPVEDAQLPGNAQPDVAVAQPNSGAQPVAIGKFGLPHSLNKTATIRRLMGAEFTIKAGAGVHEPLDALRLVEAGADAVMLGSGLVYAGPGLPKRINEAIIYETVRHDEVPAPPGFWRNWGWMCLLGIGMIIGGLLAWWIGETSVLLPYDLNFLGMTVADIHNVNHHLIHFMSHDRITLAGTMISIGILYYALARYGLKYGQHWARTALTVSAVVGFSSFFLYLGYGYFDPLHALAAAVLLPMFILSLRGNVDRPSRNPVNLRNDRAWRLAMWGQLCFVALGFALTVGGLTIAGVGVTNVFVKSDLVFLNTTPALLNEANPKLISLIAHDRAGFGGALLCDALAILIIALWGISEGARWLWWALLLGGAPGFYAGLSVHYHIGYMDFLHLLPAIVALLLYIAGLILLYPYMIGRRSQNRQ